MNKSGILFTGDFCPQERVAGLVADGRYEQIFNDVLPELHTSEWVVTDLECPLIEAGTPMPKTGPHLKASPKSIAALQYAGIQVVALANNHIKDYGAQGLIETVAHCQTGGLLTVGAGSSLTEARKPLMLDVNGVRVAVLNVTENEWSNTYGDEPGANPLNLADNFRVISQARSTAAYVVVVFHGGNEFYELPSPRLKDTLRFFVDAGASAVVVHHTHVVSGYEWYRGAPIFYGLGNFCFDWPGKRKSDWNTGVAVRLYPDRPTEFDLIPFVQNDDQPGVRLLSKEEREGFDERLTRLNEIIGNDAELHNRFEAFCQDRAATYGIYLEPYRNRWLASLRKRGWLPSIFGRKKKNLYLNLIRCEAHRDVLIRYLRK